MPINSIIYARPADATHPAYFFPHEFTEKACRIFSPWAVHNDEGTRNGPISLTDATAYSVNTAFAGLVAKLGPCKVRDLMTLMGLHKGNGTLITAGPSATTLGSDSVSPLTLASAYATVASGGTYCPPIPVVSITTGDHKALKLPKNQCKKVLETDVANGVTQILKAVITSGTGYGNSLAGGRPAAGKTGTAGNSLPSGGTNETWFVGYTPQLSTAVWVGTPDDPGNRTVLKNVQIGDKHYYGEIFGSTIAAPIWKQIMDGASAGMPFRDFADPSNKSAVRRPGVDPQRDRAVPGRRHGGRGLRRVPARRWQRRELQHRCGSGRGHPAKLSGASREHGRGLHLDRGCATATHHSADSANPETQEDPRVRLDAGTAVRTATQARR